MVTLERSDKFVEVQLWQVFAGAKERWVDGYYQELLARDAKVVKSSSALVEGRKVKPLEKWASQIEKVMLVLCASVSSYNQDFGDALW